MTADDRREHLTARGYHVCRDAVVGGPVPVWYWCRCGLDRADRVSPRNRGYIDVVTGRWRWWDDATYREFSAGPWGEPEAAIEPVAQVSPMPVAVMPESDDDPLVTPFVGECLAAGMALERPQTVRLLDGRDLGNRYMQWRGRTYLAFSATRRVVLHEYMAPWEPLTLLELLATSAPTAPDRSPVTASAPSRPVPPPMTYGLPVPPAWPLTQRRLFQ